MTVYSFYIFDRHSKALPGPKMTTILTTTSGMRLHQELAASLPTGRPPSLGLGGSSSGSPIDL